MVINMKVRYSLALIPFLVIIIIMLQTCSVKDEVTQPVQKKTAKKILKKNSSVKPTEIFSLSTKDTTIILPKSQRMIVVQKAMPITMKLIKFGYMLIIREMKTL